MTSPATRTRSPRAGDDRVPPERLGADEVDGWTRDDEVRRPEPSPVAPCSERDDRSDGRIATPGGVLAFTRAGAGEPVVLIHGLGGSRQTWRHLVGPLARHHTVIAVDLPGHGDSDAPHGDYSPGAHAAAVRDLMVALGLPRASLVGHSLGGGVAVQFAYQFPDRTSRLALVSSGGFGAGVTPLLLGAMLPGAETILGLVGRVPSVLMRPALSLMGLLPCLVARDDVRPIAADLRGMVDPRRRHGFVRTARAVIDWHGQTARATPYLRPLDDLPVMLAWGTDDRTIPPDQHEALARTLPARHVVEILGAGHYPQETAVDRLLPRLEWFLSSTVPFGYDDPTRLPHLDDEVSVVLPWTGRAEECADATA